MEKVIFVVLILVGLVNFSPAVGALSNEMLSRLYSIDVQSMDLLILLRHRAVLFGLIGAFIIYSAFKPSFRVWAIVMGLVSMLSFIAMALFVGGYGAGIRKVLIVDIIASFGLIAALSFFLFSKRKSRA
jgi:hypothetical protein